MTCSKTTNDFLTTDIYISVGSYSDFFGTSYSVYIMDLNTFAENTIECKSLEEAENNFFEVVGLYKRLTA